MNRILRTSIVIATLCATSVAALVAAVVLILGGVDRSSDATPADPAAPPAAVEVPRSTPDRVVRAPRHVGAPTRLLVPAIHVDERLFGVGLKADGAMETPQFGEAGWYELGPRPGARGPAVIVAHVHGPAGDDVFARLHELRPGDTVTVRRTDGVATFVVDDVDLVRKEALPYHRIWKRSDQALLRLITCGGEPDPVTRMYPDNTIVYAHLA